MTKLSIAQRGAECVEGYPFDPSRRRTSESDAHVGGGDLLEPSRDFNFSLMLTHLMFMGQVVVNSRFY